MDFELRLKNQIKINKSTLLGIGPMSKNIVDAAIEISNQRNIPLMLIASRRQVDSEEHGKGYVENWSTKEFSDYVSKKDKLRNIILCRDHGGPWQNDFEYKNKFNLKKAMLSAKISFENDIKNNFKIIHIDPSIDPNKKNSIQAILTRIFELYEFCYSTSKKFKKKIIFELGTEEQNSGLNTLEEIEYWINKIKVFCNTNKLPLPFFIVTQTGTKVMELKNIGSFDSDIREKNQLPIEIQVPKIVELAEKNNFFIKEHNADYLSDDALKWHPRLSIHAANVAPEFGTTETKTLINLFNKFKMKKQRDDFLEISYKSNKWKKWIIKNSNSSSYDKSIISGHYVFCHPKVIELKKDLDIKLNKYNLKLDKQLRESIKLCIKRYLYSFRLLKY